MTRLLLTCLLATACAAAQAQLTKPVLIDGPAAAGSSLQQAEEVIQLAAQHGYNGVTLGPGIERMTDPSNIDLSGVQAATHLAMQSGLKYICWRLDADIPNNQTWADDFNGGTIWPVATRPPSSTWLKISSIWQAIRDTSANQIIADGGNPSVSLLFVIGDEPGIGGVGGPSLGPWSYSGFYYNLFQATGDPTWFLIAFPESLEGSPEGFIDADYWTMMRNIRGHVTFGAKCYAVSFEGSEASLPEQMSCVAGTDAQGLYANCAGYGINVFAPNARRSFDAVSGTFSRAAFTPVQAAQNLANRLTGLINTTKSNPILANEHIVLTEFNISSARIPDFADAFPYREEMLKQMINYPNLDAVMIFTAYSSDPSTQSVQLFNRTVTNGVVSITPVGSNAVGPAYLNMVP